MRLFNKTILIGVSAFVLLAIGTPVLAIESTDDRTQPQTRDSEKTVPEKRISENEDTPDREANKLKLSDIKLKVCQKHEKNITNIMSRIADRGQKQIDLFTLIADRTKDFYVKKGNTVASYDSLVADVAAKKAAAEAAVQSVTSTITTFKCDGTDPKGIATGFKESLKAEIAVLKAYKTSVKNLIVAVKSVQSDASKTNTETIGDQS